MLQADAPGVLPPPGAFLFSVYFHDSCVEMVLEPSRIDIRSGSPRHFALLSRKYTLNNFSSSKLYSKYLLYVQVLRSNSLVCCVA